MIEVSVIVPVYNASDYLRRYKVQRVIFDSRTGHHILPNGFVKLFGSFLFYGKIRLSNACPMLLNHDRITHYVGVCFLRAIWVQST